VESIESPREHPFDYNHIRGYIVVQRSPEEIKARQSMLGGNSVTDGTEIF
jgi:hypothetical protein